MGKAAIFAVLAFLAMGAFYSMSSQQSMIRADERLSNQQHEQLVRNGAIVGYEIAKRKLTESFADMGPIKGTYEGANYSVNVEVNESNKTAKITSVGTHKNKKTRVTVLAEVSQVAQLSYAENTAKEASDFMQYALVTDADLDFNGNVSTDVIDAKGNSGSEHNANIHTNGFLSINGASASVRGFGTYVDGVDINKVDKIFNPYKNDAGDPVVAQGKPVEIPSTFNALEVYSKSLTSGFPYEISNGDLNLSGDFDAAALGATAEKPLVYLVDGNLTASSNATITGHVMFVVEGDMELSGNVRSGSPSLAESHVAFYVEGDSGLLGLGNAVEIGGNAEIYGQIFSAGDLEFSGTPKIYGSVAVNGNATMSGTPDFVFVPPSKVLTTPFQSAVDTTMGFLLNSYRTF